MSAVSVRLEGLPGSTRPRIQGRSVSASGAVRPAHAHFSPTYEAWRKGAHAEIKAAIRERRMRPIAGMVEVHIEVVVVAPMRPALRKGAARSYFIGKPDVDNAAKGCLDALVSGGVLADDSQVVCLTVRRVRGAVAAHEPAGAGYARERSCCDVTVTPLEVSDGL